MKNIPNKIHLVLGTDSGVEDFKTLQDVTWCSDKIYDDDLEFISVDFISARIKELEAEIENEDSEYSITNCRFAIKELKNLIK